MSPIAGRMSPRMVYSYTPPSAFPAGRTVARRRCARATVSFRAKSAESKPSSPPKNVIPVFRFASVIAMDDLLKQVEALSVKPTRLSRETHLREWYRDVQSGVDPKEARGKSGTPRYMSVMNLRKREDCPYNDDEPELKEAWIAFKGFFPPDKQSDAYYLEEFGRLYTETQDFKTACGTAKSYRFNALKNIVDNDLEVSPELAGYKALLKSNWEYESRRFTENVHLHEFFQEYNEHGDFKKARGENNSARYSALCRIKNKPKEECNELELRLKEVWIGRLPPQEYLEAFFQEYDEHGDFEKARGGMRFMPIRKIINTHDDECNGLEWRFKRLWYDYFVQCFFKDYEVDNDFEEAFLKTKERERALYELMQQPWQSRLAVKFRQLCITKEREEAERVEALAKQSKQKEQDFEWTEEVEQDFEEFLQDILSRRLSGSSTEF